MKLIVLLLFAFLGVLSSCREDKYEKVYALYSDDSLKIQAAQYLIGNMTRHYTIQSDAKDSLIRRMMNSKTTIDNETINQWWTVLSVTDSRKRIPDADVIPADFIINNIDKAFDIWNSVPWKEEINFKTFCNYILPYRIMSENISSEWRDSLRAEYLRHLTHDMSLKDAFSAIHSAVYSKITKTKPTSFPYILNAMEMRNIYKGSCLQCCIYECYVMRALGIPVAIDGIRNWANYGFSGHSWVALIMDDGTYTIDRYSNTLQKYNAIDASEFKIDSLIEDSYPYEINFKKKCAKIDRITFEDNKPMYNDYYTDKQTFDYFTSPFAVDVSKKYNLKDSIVFNCDTNNEYVYLCIYKTGRDWIPVCYTRKTNAKCAFKELGDSIAYLPVVYTDNGMTPICNPILLTRDSMIFLNPNTQRRRNVVVNRKYPLVGHFVDIWSNMKGATIEASNWYDFRKYELLNTVRKTPIFRNVYSFSHRKKYRYFRIKMSDEGIVPLSEIEVYNNGELLAGTPSGNYLDNAYRCFDRDTYTIIQNQQKGYSVSLDFGRPMSFDKVVFFLKNDGDFVVPGDKYELLYYDKGWISCGSVIAQDFFVEFKDVPDNALLLLKNRSQGVEERIFTFEHDKQVWW